MTHAIAALAAVAGLALAGQAHAERWAQVMAADPYASSGMVHWVDMDSVVDEDDYVSAWIAFATPEAARDHTIRTRFRWEFDCIEGYVEYLGTSTDGVYVATTGDAKKGDELSRSLMGGVTYALAELLCF